MSYTCACGRTLYPVATTSAALIVEAGVIDDVAIEAFTQGQCHALAAAVHEFTGWPLVGLATLNDWAIQNDVTRLLDENGMATTSAISEFVDHVMVRRPDGLLVDIEGAHTALEVFSAEDDEDVVYPDPVWGLMPAESVAISRGCTYEELVEDLRDEWSVRLVGLTLADTLALYARTAAVDAARTMVAPLLASLPPLAAPEASSETLAAPVG